MHACIHTYRDRRTHCPARLLIYNLHGLIWQSRPPPRCPTGTPAFVFRRTNGRRSFLHNRAARHVSATSHVHWPFSPGVPALSHGTESWGIRCPRVCQCHVTHAVIFWVACRASHGSSGVRASAPRDRHARRRHTRHRPGDILDTDPATYLTQTCICPMTRKASRLVLRVMGHIHDILDPDPATQLALRVMGHIHVAYARGTYAVYAAELAC